MTPHKKTNKRKPGARKLTIYALLISIVVLLSALILIIPEYEPPIEAGEIGAGTEPDTSVAIGESESNTAAELPVHRGDIYIIIDDVGNNLAFLKPFLEFPEPITFAVLPQLAFSAESARRISEAGKEMILHQPMEPVGDQDPGPGAIYTWMEQEEIFAVIDRNLSDLPGAVGINNHMGSKATADEKTMTALFTILAERGLFFIDSVTTENSVCERVASEFNVPYGERNSMFLDNDEDEKSIADALNTGLGNAEKHGHAVVIGHVQNRKLADLLMSEYRKIVEMGFTFRHISELDFQEN